MGGEGGRVGWSVRLGGDDVEAFGVDKEADAGAGEAGEEARAIILRRHLERTGERFVTLIEESMKIDDD